MLTLLKFKPGVSRDRTRYGETGNWFDSNWVRFRQGQPEKMGGWQKSISTAFLGTCRNIVGWNTLDGSQYTGLGTNLKYYVSDGGSYTDVTPIRRTVTLSLNPLAVTVGGTTVTVTDAGNGSVVGDYVTLSGATTFGGIPIGDLNKEHVIASIVSASAYTIVVATTATSTASGGGAAVVANYQINVGLDTSVPGVGWGAGTWGHDTWGSDSSTGTALQLRVWSSDTFGEDLITNVRDGGIYYWDATTPTARMVYLDTLVGANKVPVVATQIMVSAEERHVIAFGANPIGSATQDPLFVRWSDTENAAEWEPLATNSAGGYRLSIGTRIIGVVHSRSEILVWTDMALYSMRWTGVPYTFSFTQIGIGTNMIAQNGAISVNDICVWMGRERFYIYDGRMKALDCPVSDYIFRRINTTQLQKVFAFSNTMFNEVGWLYPSEDGGECDSYVIFNTLDRIWYFGSLARSAWLDRGPSYYPVAAAPSGYLYAHEFGFDDGSTNPPSGINAFIESAPIESSVGGQGERLQFVDRLIPDVTFRNSTAIAPSVSMTLSMRNYPGASTSQSSANDVVSSATVPVQLFTEQCFVRLRGRTVALRVESGDLGVTWRLGAVRIGIRPDGRR